MTMLTEPHAPWLRDLNRLFTSEGAVASFIPPEELKPRRVEIKACTAQPRELQESPA
jgi:hypothetical protein